MKSMIVLILFVMMTSCASKRGIDCASLRDQITPQKTAPTDLEPPPPLPHPYKLGIYFSTPKLAHRCGSFLTWLPEDRNQVVEIGTALKNQKIISDFFIITDASLEDTDKKAIRIAATAGADAVLIVNGMGDIDRYNNRLGYTYFLLLTTFFVPGTEADGIFLVSASLWDTRNEVLYTSAEGEGRAREIRPALFIDENKIIKTAKTDAMAALKEQLQARLVNTEAK